MTTLTIAAIWLLASIPLGLAISRCIPPTLDDRGDEARQGVGEGDDAGVNHSHSNKSFQERNNG